MKGNESTTIFSIDKPDFGNRIENAVDNLLLSLNQPTTNFRMGFYYFGDSLKKYLNGRSPFVPSYYPGNRKYLLSFFDKLDKNNAKRTVE